MFWDDEGAPLVPYFTIPNKRGLLISTSGTYHLVPSTDGKRPRLIESLTSNSAVLQKIAPEEVTLEDVFIARTGRTLAQDTRVKA